MKLAALGVVTVAIGVALSLPGLVGIGAWWVVVGFFARRHAAVFKALQPTAPGSRASTAKPAVDGRTFALGTLLWLALGIPSLAVGLGQVGIDPEHQDWRWLPVVVGGLALGIGVVGAVLYLAGSALLASGGQATPTHPATLWIRAMRETGTFVNERPRIELELRVEPEAATGIAGYDVTKRATVPFTALGSLRVGDGFRALVAGPDDPASMDIHWDEPVEGV
ncbi:MAG TPA: hypothetical protein VFK41_07495 [Nocardioidaceae bacterium]|nr:hypothetical protein [Nocardioidaceae bacterium]